MKTPCKDCQRRALACWDRCKDYQEFKKKAKQIAAKREEMYNFTAIRNDTLRRRLNVKMVFEP